MHSNGRKHIVHVQNKNFSFLFFALLSLVNFSKHTRDRIQAYTTRQVISDERDTHTSHDKYTLKRRRMSANKKSKRREKTNFVYMLLLGR